MRDSRWSAHKNEEFGCDYGVLIKKWWLPQRAVFLIDRIDCVVYTGYVADQMTQPDYNAAVTDARASAAIEWHDDIEPRGASW